MQNELPFKEKRSDKGFQHISEILPAYTEKLLDRYVAANYPPIPDDEAGQLNWVNENL